MEIAQRQTMSREKQEVKMVRGETENFGKIEDTFSLRQTVLVCAYCSHFSMAWR